MRSARKERDDAVDNLLPRTVFKRQVVARALDGNEFRLWDEFLDLVSFRERHDLVCCALQY